jgi:hypothetical protein
MQDAMAPTEPPVPDEIVTPMPMPELKEWQAVDGVWWAMLP